MANIAGSIFLHSEQRMPFHPKLFVISRLLITVHIDMAHQAILSRTVRVVANSHDIAPLQLRYSSEILGKKCAVAILAFFGQRLGMHKTLAAWSLGLSRPIL
jgi:hypothetical protein